MDFCIIGAGPTGLGAAHRLAELGVRDVAVFEQSAHVGGLAASYTDPEGFTWDFGVHVTHSHYREFDRLFELALPGGYRTLERRSWIHAAGAYVPYPFQYNIHHLPPDARDECIAGLQALRERGADGQPENFEAWIRATFGDGIAHHFLLPYNRKIWSIEPREMTYQWIGERVPVVDIDRVLRNVERGEDDVAWGPNHTFQFPERGGTGAIWQGLAEQLPEGTLRLEQRVTGIDPRRRTLRLADGLTHHWEHLVSTIPLPELARLCGREDLAAQTARLRHTRVTVVGVALPIPLPEELRGKTWVYCADPEIVFYRLTPFSDFSPHNVPDPACMSSLLCEISLPGGEDMPPEEASARVLANLRRGGFVPALPSPPRTWVCSAPYGYPVATHARDEVLAHVLPALEADGIYSRGRFGGWKYEVANMDHCVMQGVEVVDRLVNGTPERTLPDPELVNRGES